MQSIEPPRGTVIFHPASFADSTQFRELRLYALQEAPMAFSADYQTNFNAPKSSWENRLKPEEHANLLFAEHDKSLIGMAAGVRKGETLKTCHTAGIWGVYVRPEWRRLHIAEGLIEAFVQWAKTKKVEFVKLAVVTTNTPAIRCYERCGFKTYGTDPRVIFYEGKYYDEYWMSREITNGGEQTLNTLSRR
jgi:ribosomal protein S18 acetylase RimI-like enzyme